MLLVLTLLCHFCYNLGLKCPLKELNRPTQTSSAHIGEEHSKSKFAEDSFWKVLLKVKGWQMWQFHNSGGYNSTPKRCSAGGSKVKE